MTYWSDALDFLASLGCPQDHLLNLGCVEYEPVVVEDDDGHEYTGRRRKGWIRSGFVPPERMPYMLNLIGPEELGVRLLSFEQDTSWRLRRQRRHGYLTEAAAVLGLLVDIDADERRSPDERIYSKYTPTVEDAIDIAVAVLPPTWAFDGGGGTPCTYLFPEPVPIEGHERRLRSVARRFPEPFREAVTAEGWAFDSPPAATSWCRLPAATTRYESHLVTIEVRGPRYTLEELEDFVSSWPEYRGDHYLDTSMTEWRGQPIPRPSAQDARSGRATHAQVPRSRERGKKRGRR